MSKNCQCFHALVLIVSYQHVLVKVLDKQKITLKQLIKQQKRKHNIEMYSECNDLKFVVANEKVPVYLLKYVDSKNK